MNDSNTACASGLPIKHGNDWNVTDEKEIGSLVVRWLPPAGQYLRRAASQRAVMVVCTGKNKSDRITGSSTACNK